MSVEKRSTFVFSGTSKMVFAKVEFRGWGYCPTKGRCTLKELAYG